MAKFGVMLTRLQPVHNGHISVLKQILKENEYALIIIGSANKSGTERNPFSVTDRKGLLIDSIIGSNLDINRIRILELDDWSMENAYKYKKEWGNFLYYNIVNAIHQKNFTFYYNDDISIVKGWFVDEIAERIEVRNTPRTDDISSTRVREAILSNDLFYLKRAVPDAVYSFRDDLKERLKQCDKEDFIMQ
jgi:nicotinamide-nucleotide adenylyltransferase